MKNHCPDPIGQLQSNLENLSKILGVDLGERTFSEEEIATIIEKIGKEEEPQSPLSS